MSDWLTKQLIDLSQYLFACLDFKVLLLHLTYGKTVSTYLQVIIRYKMQIFFQMLTRKEARDI